MCLHALFILALFQNLNINLIIITNEIIICIIILDVNQEIFLFIRERVSGLIER